MKIGAFLDLETTGLEFAQGHRIFEIALLLYDFDTETKMGAYCKRVNPGCAVSARAAQITGVTWRDLVNEPPYQAIAGTVDKLLSASAVIVAHNGDHFDFPFLKHHQEQQGFRSFPAVTVDTIHARWSTFNGKSPNLGELAFALGVPYDPSSAHGALYDTTVLAQCFFAARKLGYFALPS